VRERFVFLSFLNPNMNSLTMKILVIIGMLSQLTTATPILNLEIFKSSLNDQHANGNSNDPSGHHGSSQLQTPQGGQGAQDVAAARATQANDPQRAQANMGSGAVPTEPKKPFYKTRAGKVSLGIGGVGIALGSIGVGLIAAASSDGKPKEKHTTQTQSNQNNGPGQTVQPPVSAGQQADPLKPVPPSNTSTTPSTGNQTQLQPSASDPSAVSNFSSIAPVSPSNPSQANSSSASSDSHQNRSNVESFIADFKEIQLPLAI
jgi:hypothetical protein